MEQIGNALFIKYQLPEYSGDSNLDRIAMEIRYSFNSGLTYPIRDQIIYFCIFSIEFLFN